MKIQRFPPPLEKIEIKLADNQYFADVAFLLDRNDFLGEVAALRKKWQLDKQLLQNRVKSFPLDVDLSKISDNVVEYENKLYNFSYVDSLAHEEKIALVQKYKKALREDPEWDFTFDIQDLRKKYARPHNFDKVIQSAVLYGVVQEEDYKPYELKVIRPQVEYLPFFEDQELVISFSPLVNKSDILKLLHTELESKRKDYEVEILGESLPKFSKKSAIEEHRNWYWLFHKDGLTAEEIATQAKRQDGANGISKAIKRYTEILTKAIPEVHHDF